MLGRLPPLLLVLLPSQALDTGEQNSNKRWKVGPGFLTQVLDTGEQNSNKKVDPEFGNLRMRLKRLKRKP